MISVLGGDSMHNSVLCYLEDTVSRVPNKVAFFDKDKEITFRELKERALDLAYYIVEKYHVRNMPVLIYLPKEVESIISFMGVLYSGNFYTPTDIRFPLEKVDSVIKALQPKMMIVNTKTKEKLEGLSVGQDVIIINMDEIPRCNRYDNSQELIDQILDVDPVYIFFTSGSTGVPKGVIINNHNIVDYIDWAVNTLPIDEHTIMGSQSPFYFDISTQDIYATLKTGATLGIIPVGYFAFPVQVLNFIRERHINFLYWVPSAFVNIANFKLLEKVCLDEVELIMFGGEVMPVKQLNYWKKYLPNLKTIANVYGPTEATVNCTYYIVNREFDETQVLPLGKACENTGLLVMDDNGCIVRSDQINVLGELCVYGSSLSAGYWGDLDKTHEKFVRNPLNPYYEQKMYLTGDLVYYNELGELVFAGRKDFQIKHMGYRIELGEIENAAMQIEGMKNVCADYDREKKQIVLFYVSADKEMAEDDVLKALDSIIPKYMLPSKLIPLRGMPLNDNGKIDRKQLHQEYVGI